jgi:hypothetical protein
VADPERALQQHLPAFIREIQAIPEARSCLSDVPESDIEMLADSLTTLLRRFGMDVKGVDSYVLPSKTAHFLLLGLVPAYDIKVICRGTLSRLASNARSMHSYLLMCWWVLQQFRQEGTLDEARDQVARYMLSQQMVWTRHLPRPREGHWLLHSMDSVVAEYTLIQMASTVQHEYLLRWANRPLA